MLKCHIPLIIIRSNVEVYDFYTILHYSKKREPESEFNISFPTQEPIINIILYNAPHFLTTAKRDPVTGSSFETSPETILSRTDQI